MDQRKNYYSLSDGEVEMWIEQEAIHLKAADKLGDPVELTKRQALDLADNLKQFAAKIAD
jgi:hypothetical protein